MGMYVQTKNLGQIDPVTATLIAQQGGDLLRRLFAGDPRKGRDTQKVEELGAWLQPIWDRARDTVGQLGLEKVNIQTNLAPYSASEAAQLTPLVNQANQETLKSYERSESKGNFVHITMVPVILRRLNLIAAQGGGGIFSQLLPTGGGTTASSLLPWGVAAAGLYFLS